MEPLPEYNQILADVRAALANGPLPLLELATAIESGTLGTIAASTGLQPVDYLDLILGDTDDTWESDGRVFRSDLMIEGAVFSHLLTEGEVTAGMVEFTPDFVIVDFGVEDVVELTTGGSVSVEFPSEDPEPFADGAIVGPFGWLDGFSAGDLLLLTRIGARLEVGRNAATGPGDDEVAALADAFDALEVSSEAGVDAFPLVLEALTQGNELFSGPVRPLSELLVAAGLEARGAFVGRAAATWDPPGVVWDRDRRRRLADRWGFQECCEEEFDAVVEAWRSHLASDPTEPSARDLARALGHSTVAPAFVEYVLEYHPEGSEAVAGLADAIIAGALRSAAPALYLRAANATAAGDVLAAEADLGKAIRLDPEYGPALLEAASFAADRGDGARALSLLRRASAPDDDPEIVRLASMFEPWRGVGRNEPCPCGSGRKFKACHQRRPSISDADRVRWLADRITRFALRQPGRVIGVASSAVREDFEIEDLTAMAADPFIADLAIFESGAVDEYLQERGPLLPQEDRDLLDLWALAELRLWEVVAADPGRSITLRDTKTGDEITASERTGSETAEIGDYFLARAVPAFGQNWLIGQGLAVDLRHRDSLIELLDRQPDADELAMWYGWATAPPRLSNREGDDLVFCTAYLRPADGGWDGFGATLDRAYEQIEPGDWVENFTLPNGETILRASLRREGDELVVEVNSEERLDRVLASLPNVTVVGEERQPARTARDIERMSAREGGDRAEPQELDPETIAHLEAYVEEMEDRWLDESIPALDGITPRQAADDPTRREDLLALLRQFDVPLDRAVSGRAVPLRGFDIPRLRRKLGLDD